MKWPPEFFCRGKEGMQEENGKKRGHHCFSLTILMELRRWFSHMNINIKILIKRGAALYVGQSLWTHTIRNTAIKITSLSQQHHTAQCKNSNIKADIAPQFIIWITSYFRYGNNYATRICTSLLLSWLSLEFYFLDSHEK